MPDPTDTPKTFNDLLTAIAEDNFAITSDGADIAKATADLNNAQSKLAADKDALDKDEAAAGSAVTSTARFVVNPDGSATVYESDGQGGFVIKTALPADAPLS
jgi:hypothetical protein